MQRGTQQDVSIALDCLERTLPPIDEDQKLALLHALFKGTTVFGGELAKLQEANTKCAATFPMFPQPTAPSTSYSTRPYVGRGKSFKDKKGFKRPVGRCRGQGRSAPSATITRPGQSIHPSSRKYLRFAFQNRVYQFQVLPFGLNTAPQVFTRLGHMVTGYLHRQGISVIPYLDDWLIHHPDPKVLLRHQAQLMNTLDLVVFVLNRKKSELDLTRDIQFL